MGLKEDLINAKVQSLKVQGAKDEALETAKETGSAIETECELITEAISKFITSTNFTITELKAPVIIEDLKTPEQPVDVAPETLLGEYGPLLKTLKDLASLVPGAGGIIDQLEDQIKKAIKPLTQGGATLPGLDLGKDSGGLESTGYVHIGGDPDSQDAFDVEDEDGQREFTKVVAIQEDIDDLLRD